MLLLGELIDGGQGGADGHVVRGFEVGAMAHLQLEVAAGGSGACRFAAKDRGRRSTRIAGDVGVEHGAVAIVRAGGERLADLALPGDVHALGVRACPHWR